MGRRRDLGLGGFPDVGLEQAREKARELRKLAASGADLVAARDKERVVIPTFREAAEACHKAREQGWAPRHAKAFLATLELHVYPVIGKLRVDSVDEKDIVATLSPLWQTKPSAARKLRQRIGVVLDYAKGSGWRTSGAPRDGLRPLLAKQAKAGNFAAVPYEEVPALVGNLGASDATSGRLALMFTILTAARSGEVRAMRWSHLDLARKLWVRPAVLMKTGEAHSVTLSPQALVDPRSCRGEALKYERLPGLRRHGGSADVGHDPLQGAANCRAARDGSRISLVLPGLGSRAHA